MSAIACLMQWPQEQIKCISKEGVNVDISNTQALNIEDAIMLMQKEIAAHELELKKRQLEFALRLKLNK